MIRRFTEADISRETVFDSQAAKGKNTNKLALDKYYTPKDVAEHCFNKFMELYGNKVTEIIEPSAGGGVFLPLFEKSGIPYKAYDLYPEAKGVVQADFLELPLMYKKGRAFIGNPPFGAKGNLMRAFYNKCCEYGDYIAFILPVTMLNNSNSMYKFDLVHSEDLGTDDYSGRGIHCCFNIYKRSAKGLNKKPNTNLKDVTIIRNDSPKYANMDYDFRVVGFGWRSGQILEDNERDLATTYKVKVNNPKFLEPVYNAIKNMNIEDYRPTTSVRKCQKVNLIDCIKDNVKGIK